MKPIRLQPRFVERVWGTTDLAPWFPAPAATIGEVWLTADENETSEGLTLRALMERYGERLLGTAVRPAFGGRFPILVKFLFTQAKLSVQVHPDDRYGEAHEGSPGKTEMWHVLRAEEGATIVAGFRHNLDSERLREVVLDGTVEEHLALWPAAAGQTYFVPARTVHAVGAGVVICEIQQNSDITYRLWDYGRPRELHIERSLAVAERGPHPGPLAPVPSAAGEMLATCPYFATERISCRAAVALQSEAERFHLLVTVEGQGVLTAGGGEWNLGPGECWLIPAECGVYTISGRNLEVLRVYVPS